MVFSLFGTAVGAGILFLPINAGLGGFWPLVIMTLLIGPMTFFSHRGLARLVFIVQKSKINSSRCYRRAFREKRRLCCCRFILLCFLPYLIDLRKLFNQYG